MKVRHPKFPDVIKDVQDIEAWLKAGWKRLGPEPASERIVDWQGNHIDTVITEEVDDSE